MGDDRMQLPHNLTLTQRQKLAVSGVTEVVSFDDGAVVLCTQLGQLTVMGKGLQLRALSPDGGQVTVEGTVDALSYAEPKTPGGFWRRMLG